MRDSEIEQWVLREICLATGGRLKELCVSSVNRVVNLSGTVNNQAERRTVQHAAGRAKGVVKVINLINVRKRSRVRVRSRVKSESLSVSATLHLPIHTSQPSSQVAS